MGVSSQDLHPDHGARFVFERAPHTDPVRYVLEVHLAGGATVRAQVHWTPRGQCVIEPELPVRWAQDEALKLARVLHRDPKARISRWRGGPPASSA